MTEVVINYQDIIAKCYVAMSEVDYDLNAWQESLRSNWSRCVIHNKHEFVVYPAFYWPGNSETTVCFECGHVYYSDKEVIKETICLREELNRTSQNMYFSTDNLDIDRIYSCPLCIHDW